jgi:hypothetical protein
MGCITITTKGVPAFSDPVLAVVSIGTTDFTVNVKTTNTGSSRGYCTVEMYIDRTLKETITMPAVDPGQTAEKNWYCSGLNPGTTYQVCGYVKNVYYS